MKCLVNKKPSYPLRVPYGRGNQRTGSHKYLKVNRAARGGADLPVHPGKRMRLPGEWNAPRAHGSLLGPGDLKVGKAETCPVSSYGFLETDESWSTGGTLDTTGPDSGR